MRRAARFFMAVSVAAVIVTAVACQEPTQVTLDVRFATARCGEIRGTAITVGVRPQDTEEKVKSKFPSADTKDCFDSTSTIGTLVITPSDEERASVIVVTTTSYGPSSATECQPPDYTGCIVARRQFTFTKHRRLAMPITMDPTCMNVPCDAFSTCRKGLCFASEAEPCESADNCLEPGETAGGGTNVDASVDGGSPDALLDGNPGNDGNPSDDSGGNPDATNDGSDSGAGPDGGPDSGPDGSSTVDAGPNVSCSGGRIICSPPLTPCGLSGPNACCGSAMMPGLTQCVDTTGSAGNCPSTHSNGRFCCSDDDCGLSEQCMLGDPTTPRQCCTIAMIDAGAGGNFVPKAGSAMCAIQ